LTKGIIETDKGNIEVEFYEADAPKTVANFVKLAKEGYYDGLSFHRVIPGFVIQGGCPDGTGAGGPGYSIPCETEGNPHKHLSGSLSMAHRGPNTGGSQFFVCHAPQPHLDGVHTVFGRTVDQQSLDVVLAIEAGDKMNKVTIIEE
jgi:peptidyl-prolyl cis-trans isomerase B (cyclophilin B)